MRLDEYAALDGLGVAERIRRGEVRAGEVAALARRAIDRLNPVLNFLVGQPLEPADAPAPGEGSFAGAPFLIKDIGAAVEGLPQELGSALARGLVPAADSTLARRYRTAGLVLLGRSATPELGATFTTEPRTNGPCRNPWDLERSPGGSSGGAAAAVAAGVVPLAHGGDSAGSIRIPAHCCGVFGLKPTRGRTPVGPQAGEANSGLTAAHVLSRTVRDSAAALDLTAGPDSGCRYAAPGADGGYLAAVTRPPRRLRMALACASPLSGEVAPDVRRSAVEAARLCERLGHTVEEAGPAFSAEALVEALDVIWCANTHHTVSRIAELTGRAAGPATLEHSTIAMVERGAQLTADDLLGALDAMNRLSREIAAFFETYDVLICPTFASTAPRLGGIDADRPVADVRAYIRDLFALAAFTPQFNLTGQPAMSVPLHVGDDGLPIGVQFVGRFGDEATLFSLAGQLETAAPWLHRRPPVGAFTEAA